VERYGTVPARKQVTQAGLVRHREPYWGGGGGRRVIVLLCSAARVCVEIYPNPEGERAEVRKTDK
jgi:hypothetical protein